MFEIFLLKCYTSLYPLTLVSLSNQLKFLKNNNKVFFKMKAILGLICLMDDKCLPIM
jgi:hypothetical protein